MVPLADGEVSPLPTLLRPCASATNAVTRDPRQLPRRLISLGDMRYFALLSDIGGGTNHAGKRRLRILSTENFSRSRLILCRVMSGLQIISQYHSSLRAPLALLQAQRTAFDEGFIAPLRELQSIIARNGFTHTAQAELVAYAAHELASPSLSQWLEAHLRDTGVKRLQRCVASLRDAGTHACLSLGLVTSNIVYVLTELRAWAAGDDYVAIGLRPQLLTAAIEQGMAVLQLLEQLQNALTLHCSGARALALWVSNAFKLLADPPTHSADFPVAVCREALQFVHERLWCKEVLDAMGSGSSSTDGSERFFTNPLFSAAPSSSASVDAAPSQHVPISAACDALKAACTACSAAVGKAVISSIRTAFEVELPQERGGTGSDVYVVQAEGHDLGVTMLSLGGGGSSTAAPAHTIEFTRAVEAAEGQWHLERAQATLALKVGDAPCEGFNKSHCTACHLVFHLNAA